VLHKRDFLDLLTAAGGNKWMLEQHDSNSGCVCVEGAPGTYIVQIIATDRVTTSKAPLSQIVQ
jgi:hypothetical protein